jgi:hypothetical protein
MDPPGQETGRRELIPRGTPEVQPEATASAGDEPTADRGLGVPGLPEPGEHVRADLVTTGPDARAHGRDDVRRIAPELGHPLDGPADDP